MNAPITPLQQAEFIFNLAQASTKTVTLDWATRDGTAVEGIDYVSASGRLTFAPGEVSKTVLVNLLQPLTETRKFFTVAITGAVNATVDDTVPGQVVIMPNSAFRGPRGFRGDRGQRGMSAFEEAVATGSFIGSYADWLAFLRSTDAAFVSIKQPFTGAIDRTLQDFVRERVSVRDFGVKGDGTDDLAAFQKAIASGKPLFFPDGVYTLFDTLTPTTDQVWIASGKVTFRAGFQPGSDARPLLNFKAKITSYGDFTVDHRANELNLKVPSIYQGNVISGSAVLVQGDWSSIEDWKFKNAWDNGVAAVRLDDVTGKEVAGSPKYGSFRNLKTQGCGVGEHAALTPGKIGAGVDIASASAWTVSDCVDFGSYIGYILDVGAGAQCQFTNCVAFYTLLDSGNPLNGSGYGFYVGSSESSFVNCYSIGAGYRSWWIDEVGNDFVNCGAYIPQQEGVFIKAGQFKGSFRIKGAGAKQANTYDAVLIDCSAKVITELELDLHTTGSNHRFGVNATGTKTIDAHVTGSVTGTQKPINRQNYNIGSFLQNASVGAGRKFGINRDAPGMEFDIFGRLRASADRANLSYLVSVFGDATDNGTAFFEDFDTPAKRMAMGYDSVNDAFVMQAIHAGVGKKPMLLNPSGGAVMVGKGTWDSPAMFGVNRVWFDASGKMRAKATAPTSDTDGVVVGTQA